MLTHCCLPEPRLYSFSTFLTRQPGQLFRKKCKNQQAQPLSPRTQAERMGSWAAASKRQSRCMFGETNSLEHPLGSGFPFPDEVWISCQRRRVVVKLRRKP